MKAFRFALLTLAFAAFAHARPVVIENVYALVPPPDPTWEILGGFGVAIDGDYALVSGERFVADSTALNGVRHDGAVFIYKRSGTSWNYLGRLGPIAPIASSAYPYRRGGLAMKNGIAMTITDRWRIFKRTGDTFALEPVAGISPTALNGPDIEIDGDRIAAAYAGCTSDSVVLRKMGTSWKPEGQLMMYDLGCGPGSPFTWLDLQGERAAVAFHPQNQYGRPTIRLFGVSGASWSQDGEFSNEYNDHFPDLKVAISTPFTAYTTGQTGVTGVTGAGRFEPVDRYLEPFSFYSTALERAGPGTFAQRNFSFDRGAYVIHLIRANEAEPRVIRHLATLQSRSGASLGSLMDVSGNRVIVNGRTPTGGDNSVRIFELPASYDVPAVRYHDFENVAEGALWQTAPGSTFNIVRVDRNNVFRQPNIFGTAAAWLPGSVTTNQAIQAEITLRGQVANNVSWAGLVTRRTDQNNYYFATVVNAENDRVELKRIKDGVFYTLGTVAVPVDVNKKQRLRLESIGSAHRVYLNDRQVLEAHDFTFAAGAPGIMTDGFQADYDNVIVSPAPFTSIYSDDFSSSQPDKWIQGEWPVVDGVLVQPYISRFIRIWTGAPTDDQIVRVRVKPTSFMEENNWVGLAGRLILEDYYLYVSLHERDVIALWTRTGGVSTQLATARTPVNVGTWYDLRLEVINDIARVFVDDKLILTATVPEPILNGEVREKGHVGLITYKATAEYDDFIAYQP